MGIIASVIILAMAATIAKFTIDIVEKHAAKGPNGDGQQPWNNETEEAFQKIISFNLDRSAPTNDQLTAGLQALGVIERNTGLFTDVPANPEDAEKAILQGGIVSASATTDPSMIQPGRPLSLAGWMHKEYLAYGGALAASGDNPIVKLLAKSRRGIEDDPNGIIASTDGASAAILEPRNFTIGTGQTQIIMPTWAFAIITILWFWTVIGLPIVAFARKKIQARRERQLYKANNVKNSTDSDV